MAQATSLPWAGPAASSTAGSTANAALRIRPATRADRNAVRKMESACFGWMRNFFGLSPKVGNVGNSDARVWIADIDGQPAGYLISYLKPLHGEKTLYVGGVGTLPACRKRGVAEALMREVFAIDSRVWLHVRASNAAAIKLYDKLGMHIAERLPKFYSNGEDALVMCSRTLHGCAEIETAQA